MGPFSLNLLLVLILLLPGLAGIADAYLKQPLQVRRVLPGSSSLIVLATVPLLALSAHLPWALGFWMNAGIAKHAMLIELPFDPNPYKLLLSRSSVSDPTDGLPLYLLTFALGVGLTPSAFLAVDRRVQARLAERAGGADRERRPDEDWLTYLIRLAEPENRYLLCYVLTRFGTDDERVGYVGTVEAVRLDRDGDVSSITLDNCDTFLLRLGRTGLEREQTERRRPLRYLTLQRGEIINTSFEVQEAHEVEDDGPSLDTLGSAET